MTEHIDLFISYDFSDREAVKRLAHAVEAQGLRVWYAQSQLKAGHWRSKVEDAIDGASGFILVVSSATGHSNEVENEFRRAAAANKPILVLFIEDCTPPLYAASLHAAKFHSEPATALALLCELIDDAARTRRNAELAYLRRVRRSIQEQVNFYCPLDFEHVSEGVTNAPDLQKLVNSAVANFSEQQTAGLSVGAVLAGGTFEVNSGDSRSRIALIGEPGAGKTSTLIKLLDELAQAAEVDNREPIPVLIPLRNYSGSRPFFEHVRDVSIREFGDLAAYFIELLSAGRIALLIDGLNEIPNTDDEDYLREIRAFLARHSTISVVVTCRVVDYTPEKNLGLDAIELAPLTPLRIRQFISNYVDDTAEADRLFWSLVGDDQAKSFHDEFLRLGGTASAFWLHSGSSPVRSDSVDRPYYHWDMWLRIREDPLSLLTLARNPYLLTLIIRVYLAHGRPTGNRYDLFTVFFRVMYEMGHGKFQGSRDQWIGQRDQARMLTSLARVMHERGAVTLSLEDALYVLPPNTGRQFLSLAEDEMLLDCNEGISFSHQLLREYFASVHVEDVWNSGSSMGRFLADGGWWLPSGWEEAVIFLTGKYARDPTRLLSWLRDDQPELTSQCLIQSGCQVLPQELQSLTAAWLPRLQRGNDPSPGRAAIGRALGRLNLDTRPGVCLLDRDGLPSIEWVAIPASHICVGNIRSSMVTAPFWMSKYLITNAQFKPFVADGGYTERHGDCWTNAGWNWKLIADRQAPDDYTEIFRLPNHPRIGTVWYEAHAYCNWLTKRLNALGTLPDDYEIRLPSEAEWEAAARGPEGKRSYPWGDEFSYDKCNVHDIRSTSPVGLYQSGASPEGVYDLVGNAWSWCLTQWDDDPTVQNNDPEGDIPRVYRGGSWAFDFNVSRWRPHELRCDQRYWIVPLDDRPDAVGFFIIKGLKVHA